MNKPIRNLAVFCMLLFVALLLNATYVQYWQADDLTSLSPHPDNKRVRDAEFSRERGAILVRGKAVAREQQVRRPLQVPARLPAGPRVRPPHRLLLPRLRARRRRGEPELDPLRQRPALFVNRVIDLVGNDDPKGGSVTADHRPRRRRRRRTTGCGRSAPNVKGAVVAIEPRTGKILAMVSSPTYDPNRLATHDFTAVGQDQAAARGPTRRARCNNRAIEEALPPGLDVQAGHRGGGAGRAGKYNPDTKVPGGAGPRPAPDQQADLVNENGGACGGDQDHADPGARGLLQRVLRRRRPQARRRRAARAGREVRLRPRATFTDLDDALTRQAVSRFPDRPRRAADRAVRDRPVRRRARPRCRWRWSVAGIANGGTVMRPYLVDEMQSPDLDVLDKTDPEPMPDQPAISPATAARASPR